MVSDTTPIKKAFSSMAQHARCHMVPRHCIGTRISLHARPTYRTLDTMCRARARFISGVVRRSLYSWTSAVTTVYQALSPFRSLHVQTIIFYILCSSRVVLLTPFLLDIYLPPYHKVYTHTPFPTGLGHHAGTPTQRAELCCLRICGHRQ